MQHLEGGNRKKVIPEDTNPTTTLPKEIIAKDKKNPIRPDHLYLIFVVIFT